LKNKIQKNPASWAGCGPRPNDATEPALRRPAKPAHSKMESGPTQPSRLSAPTRRARPHRAGAHGARGTAGSPTAEVHWKVYAKHEHPRAHSPGTYTTAGSSRDDGRRKRLRLTDGEVVLRDTMLPSLLVRRGKDRRGADSHQRWGLDKGAGSEALTGDPVQEEG
jgi:hypothetical protein